MNETPEEIIDEAENEIQDNVATGINIDTSKLKVTPIEPPAISYLNAAPHPFMPAKKETPGFVRNFTNNFIEHNTIAAGYRFTKRILSGDEAPDYSKDNIPEGWTPIAEENIADIDDKYWNMILDSRTPIELEMNRQKAMQQMEHDELLNSGSLASTLLGSLAGAVSSPEILFTPSFKAGQLTTLTSDVLFGALKAAPVIAAQSFIHEGVHQAGRIEGSLMDATVNTLVDTAFAIGLYGIARGFNFGMTADKIWKVRKFTEANYHGTTVKLDIEDGILKGLKAEAIPGEALEEGVLEAAQTFVDHSPAHNMVSSIASYMNKIPIVGSPLDQGLTSPFKTTRDFYGIMGNGSIVTKSVKAGIARPETVEESFGLMQKEAIQLAAKSREAYMQYLGLKPGLINDAKAFIKGFKDPDEYSYEAFSAKVLHSLFTGKENTDRAVNQIVSEWTEFSKNLYTRYLKAYDLPEDIMNPKTSISYAMRMYNMNKLTADPGGWRNTIVNALTKQDQQITKHMEPINTWKDVIKSLDDQLKLAKGDDILSIKAERTKAKRQLTKAEKFLTSEMQSGNIDLAIMEGRPYLTNMQLKELNKILKPVTSLDKKIIDKRKELKQLSPNEQKASRIKIKKMKEDRNALLAQLKEDAKAGNISEFLFYKQGGEIKFHSIEPNLKLRNKFNSTKEMEDLADNVRDKILGQTSDQITQEMFGFISGGTTTNPTAMRTLLVPDLDLLNGGFLHTNIADMINMYGKNLGRKIALKEKFKDVNWNNGIKDIAEQLNAELKTATQKVEREGLSSSEQTKRINKLTKDFNKSKELIENGFNYFMGITNSSEKAMRYGRNVRNLSSIGMLRGVPLLQGAELLGMVFKQGLWPVVSGAAYKLARHIGPLARRKEGRKALAHSRVGMELHMQKMSSVLFEGSPADNATGWVGKFLGASSKIAPKVFMTNFITNSLQDISQGATVSSVMADSFAFTAGKLNKRGIQRLLMRGIQPETDAQRFVDAYNKVGGRKEFGGHVVKWWEFGDAELQKKMRLAIEHDISGSILTPGMFDKPFWSKDPVLGIPLQFMGYSYAAFNKFVMPLAQDWADAKKLAPFAMMLFYGAMVEPMRKMAKGEEFEADDEKTWSSWFAEAASNSGILGYHADYIGMAAAIFDPAFLNDFKSDKFRRRPLSGILLGPPGGMADQVAYVANMFMNGDFNQAGLKKILNVWGIPIPLYLYYAINKGLQQTDIPETKRDASYYSWINKD